MGPKPFAGATIERVDSYGNYEPVNCIWASRTAQNRNQTTTIFTEEDAQIVIDLYNTNSFTYEQLAEIFKCHKNTIGDIIRLKTWQ